MPFKITSRITEGKAAVNDVATEGLRKTFQDRILPMAKQLVPIDSGATRASITVKISQTQKGPKARIFTKSGHGGYVELGTSRQPAKPFLRPAYDANIGNLLGDMKEVAVAKYK